MAFPMFLAPLIKPMLIGAGTGALGGLLTGRDPFKGAAIGAATGGLLGGIEAGAMNLSTGSIPSVASIDPTAGVGAFTETLAPSYSGALGSTGELGANMAFNLAPTAPMFSSMATDPMTGQMLASQMPNAGVGAFTQQPSMFDGLDEYFNPRDLGNVALQGIANQPRQQMIQAPAGGISRGQAPQGQDVMALLQTIRQPERRRISLV